MQEKQLHIRVFCSLYFTFALFMAVSWYNKGFLQFYNIFFDADPNTALASFAHGTWGRHAVTHAFMELFAIPVRVIEMIFLQTGVVYDRLVFRETLALVISPAFSALSILYFYRFLGAVDINKQDSIILTLFFAFAFTNLIFAILPESYAISCFLITYIFYYYASCKQTSSKGSVIIWFSLAVLMAGITITNIAVFFMVYFAHSFKNIRLSPFESLKRTVLFSLAAIIIVFAFYFLSHSLLNLEAGSGGTVSGVARFITTSAEQAELNGLNILSASINSLVAIQPEIFTNEHCKRSSLISCNSINFTRSINSPGWILASCTILFLAAFTIMRKIKLSPTRDIYLLSLLILLFNFILHVLFGRDMFLYTQHWIVPLCIILIPVFSGRIVLSSSVLILVCITNLYFFLHVDRLINMH